MKNINKDIKQNEFKPDYLLYGNENYILDSFINKFKDAFSKNGMLSVFVYNENNFDEEKVSFKLAENPFMCEKKLIILDKVKVFKNKNLDNIVEAINANQNINVILIIELEEDNDKNKNYKIDKRTKLYKLVSEIGYVCECSNLNDDGLKLFIKNILESNQKAIESTKTLFYFIEKCGNNLYNIKNELEKLISYVGDENIITKDDIDNIVSETVEAQVFKMIDYINKKDLNNALRLYADLVWVNYPKNQILSLFVRNYLQILTVIDLKENEKTNKEIMEYMKIQNWQLENIIKSSRSYKKEDILKKLKRINEIDIMNKTGLLDENIMIELLMI